MEPEHYINMLRALMAKTQRHLDIDSDNALPVALSVFTELNKDRRVEEMLKRDQLITVKQMSLLRKLGMRVNPETSKEEASQLITQQMRNNGNHNSNYRSSYRNGKGGFNPAFSFPK